MIECFDRAERTTVPDPRSEPLVLRLQVAVVGADRGHRGVLERVVEPFGSLAAATGAALARRLVVARALACPRGEVAGGREHRHVGADLGEDVLRGAGLDPAERAQHVNGWLKRAPPVSSCGPSED